MSIDPTLSQTGDELRRAQQQSIERLRPPTAAPGYEPVRFLGAGAYGEVWVAIDLNTRRRVAIKFYTHRGGVDWSLLSREVEKLAFLFADRYVVQLIDVAWDANPPYYIMEYLEHGSLADQLRSGALPAHEAVAMFREITIGLVHSHNKGVLHCDLKPANILLDQDMRPRLADFGQSRLSSEQKPALGTLFYMAPEQASLNAVPDARWDVYALGAVLYCMLTGEPPHRTASAATLITEASGLAAQLDRYRRFLNDAPPALAHRAVSGVDRELSEIVERCLELSPKKRFANPQAVLDALHTRAERHSRRPLLVLGALGPAAILIVMSLFAWNAAATSVNESEAALVQRALESNQFAARFVAESVAGHIDRRWSTLEQVARDSDFRDAFAAAVDKPRGSPEIIDLQAKTEAVHAAHPEITATSWLVYDAKGRQLARSPLDEKTIDRDFSFRDYFHGQGHDLPPGTTDVKPIDRPHRSVVFTSQATNNRMLAFSVPIWSSRNPNDVDRHVLGVVAVTVELGRFSELRVKHTGQRKQIAALVDTREDDTHRKGSIIEHPYLAESQRHGDPPPEIYIGADHVRLLDKVRESSDTVESDRNIMDTEAPATLTQDDYEDPVGGDYEGRWLAAFDPVVVRSRPTDIADTGWVVVVQERFEQAVEPAGALGRRMVRTGMLALAVVVIVVTALWGFVMIVLNESPRFKLTRWLRRGAGLSPGGLSPNVEGSSSSGSEPSVSQPDTQTEG